MHEGAACLFTAGKQGHVQKDKSFECIQLLVANQSGATGGTRRGAMRSASPLGCRAGGHGHYRKGDRGAMKAARPAGSVAAGAWAGATLPGEDKLGYGTFGQDPLHPAALRFHLTAPLAQQATSWGRSRRI